MTPMPLYAVSACLAGHPCRYDGGSNTCPAVVALVRAGRALPLCPEGLADLPVPRPPCEWREGRVLCRDGRDLTQAFQRGAHRALDAALAHGCTAAILKSRSPSCGINGVYDGSFSKTLTPGQGLFAALLAEQGVALYSEEALPPELEDIRPAELEGIRPAELE